ncbi:MAG: hypothetical protein ACR2GY_07495 [Phycisphaerales bacterium]
MNRRSALIVCIAGGAAVAGLTVFLTQWSRPPSPVDVAFNETRSAVSAITMAALSEAAIDSALDAMLIKDDTEGAVDAPALERLREHLSDAIRFYYLEDEADAYIAWRREQGATFKSRDDLDRHTPWPIETSFIFIDEHQSELSFAFQKDADIPGLFEQFWIARREVDGGRNVPQAIAQDDKGVRTHLRFAGNDSISSDFGDKSDRDDALMWFGGIAMASRNWFDVPHADDVLQAQSVVVAQTGIFFEFADGVRRPLVFLCVLDETRQAWYLQAVGMTNHPNDYVAWPWEL